MTKLPQYLFSGSGVKNISWPSTLTEIGPYAFQSCTALEGLTIPEGVATIGTGAFSSCTKLTSITLPHSLTTLGTSVFSSCTALTSMPELPSTLTTLPEWTFSSCTGLTEVTVPETITLLGGGAFANCSNLTSATVLGDLAVPYDYYYWSNGSPFQGCGLLATVSLPDDMAKIPGGMFASTGITGIDWPAALTEIGAGAFYNCDAARRCRAALHADHPRVGGILRLRQDRCRDDPARPRRDLQLVGGFNRTVLELYGARRRHDRRGRDQAAAVPVLGLRGQEHLVALHAHRDRALRLPELHGP